MKLMNILLEEVNELEAIKAKLEADPENKYLIFTIDKDRDEIRVGGKEAEKFYFVQRNENEEIGGDLALECGRNRILQWVCAVVGSAILKIVSSAQVKTT